MRDGLRSWIFQIVFSILLLVPNSASSYVVSIQSYRDSSGHIVILLGDVHSLYSAEENREQMEQFFSEIVEPAERHHRPVDILHEAYLTFSHNTKEFQEVCRIKGLDPEDATKVTVEADANKYTSRVALNESLLPQVGHRREGARSVTWMDLPLSSRFQNRNYNFIKLRSVDPRFPKEKEYFRLVYQNGHASLRNLLEIGACAVHIRESEFNQVMSRNADLTEIIHSIDHELDEDKEQIFHPMKALGSERFENLVCQPMSDLLSSQKVTQQELDQMKEIANSDESVLAKALDKFAVLESQVSRSENRATVVVAGVLHTQNIAQYLEKLGYQKIMDVFPGGESYKTSFHSYFHKKQEQIRHRLNGITSENPTFSIAGDSALVQAELLSGMKEVGELLKR